MTYFFKTAMAAGATLALLSTPTFADDKKTDAAAPLTANSTASLKKEFMGKHVDELPEIERSNKAVDNPDRVICKEIERLGSRLRKRKVCATKKEWDQSKSGSVNAMRQMQTTRGGDRT